MWQLRTLSKKRYIFPQLGLILCRRQDYSLSNVVTPYTVQKGSSVFFLSSVLFFLAGIITLSKVEFVCAAFWTIWRGKQIIFWRKFFACGIKCYAATWGALIFSSLWRNLYPITESLHVYVRVSVRVQSISSRSLQQILAAEVSNTSSSRSERGKLAAQVSRTSKKQKVAA